MSASSNNAPTMMLALLVASVSRVRADIPVHCVQPDIVGKWRFHVGHWMTNGVADPMCGGQHPDEQDGHKELTPPYTKSKPSKQGYYLSDAFRTEFSTEVLLGDWTSNVISTDSKNGTAFKQNSTLPVGEWTMVYDEGYHVSMAQDGVHHSFFAFSKYMLGPDDDAGSTDNFDNAKHSYCDMTLLGWYKQFDPETRGIIKEGCWWGERIQSLHNAEAGASSAASPLLPVPPLPGKASSGKLNDSPPESPIARGLNGDASEEDVLQDAALLRGGQDASKSVFRRCMQITISISCLLICFAAYKLFTASKDSSTSLATGWWFLMGFGLLALFLSGFAIWHSNSHLDRPPMQLAKLGKHNTIAEAADALHAHVQAARRKENLVVRYQTDPEKLKAWVRERKEHHGIDIDEHSSVLRLLDAISPPLKVGVPGFSTEQVIGPVKQKAIEQQAQTAAKLGIPPSQLTIEDVEEPLNNGAANHHETRTFSMHGKKLTSDGWKTLSDFDWREVSFDAGGGVTIKNFVNQVADQGGCGSCYALAATSMITSRLMIKYPELHEKFAADRGADRISVGQQLSCNQYVQGCGGGYPYLISKWSFENDIVTQKCHKHAKEHTNSTCPKSFSGPECEDRFRVKSWRYTGGALGRCGMHHLCEEAIREELYKGGPLAVAIEPTAGFSGYSGGVLHDLPGMQSPHLNELSEVHTSADNVDCKDTDCYVWRKVDHSVLLVGWGEDNSMGFFCQARVHKIAETDKTPDPGCDAITDATLCRQKAECVYKGFPYWIVQNSYGKSFGREGYLYFGPRGQDPMFVESMSMAADVEWIHGFEENQQGSSLQAKEGAGKRAIKSSNARARGRQENSFSALSLQ